VPAPALGQAPEAVGQAREWGWEGRPVRQRLERVLGNMTPPTQGRISLFGALFCWLLALMAARRFE